MTRNVVVVGFPGIQALDVVGPFDVFTGASMLVDGGYDVTLASVDGEPVSTGNGLTFVAKPLPDPAQPIEPWCCPAASGRTPHGSTPSSSAGSRL